MKTELKTDPSLRPVNEGKAAAIAFAVRLGTALQRYGTPAHRLEETLTTVLLRLGYEGQFFVTPTGLFAAIGGPEEQRTALVRTDPGEVNLEKVSDLDELTRDVVYGRLTPTELTS